MVRKNATRRQDFVWQLCGRQKLKLLAAGKSMIIFPVICSLITTGCVAAEHPATQQIPLPSATLRLTAAALQLTVSDQVTPTPTKGVTLYPTYTPSKTHTPKPTLTYTATRAGPSEVFGQFVNAVTLGKADYEIWGEADLETRIVSYLYIVVSKEHYHQASGSYPVVLVTAPLDQNRVCLAAVHDVLMTLEPISP